MRRLLALACLPWLLGAAAAPARDPVAYRLRPVLEAGRLTHLAVELRFQGDDDGVTELQLPDRFGGEAGLLQHLSDIVVTGAASTRPEPARLRLTHGRGAQVTVRYRVRNGRGGEPVADYRPDLGPDGFTVLGEAVFAWPTGRLSGPASAEFAPLPSGWRGVTDLDRARTVEEVRESVTSAGSDVSVESRPGLVVAMRGRLAFDAAAFAELQAQILAAQRAAYGRPGPFTAVVQAVPEDRRVDVMARYLRDGVGRGDGTAYYVTPGEPLGVLKRIAAHEPVHDWLPREVGGLPAGAAEPSAYWFSEGFADFVGLRSLVRAGVTDLEGYLSELGYRTVDHAGASAVSNAEFTAGYGRRPELRQLPYRQGLALALLWDSRLRAATEGRVGVDDVLMAMRKRAKTGSLTADQLFPLVYGEMGGPDLSRDLAAYVRDGRPIPLPRDLYGGCLLSDRRDGALRGSDGKLFLSDARLRLRPGMTPAEAARCRRSMIGG